MNSMKYVSSLYVIDRFFMGGLVQSIPNKEDLIQLIRDCIDKIGAHNTYEYAEVTYKNVDNQIIPLPCDFKWDIEVKANTKTLNKMNYVNTPYKDDVITANAYFIDGRYIKFFSKYPEVTLRYAKYPTDENDYPYVIDDIFVFDAIEQYLMYKLARVDYMVKRINYNEYKQLETDAELKIAKARGELVRPKNELENEASSNIFNKMQHLTDRGLQFSSQVHRYR